jgi:hypothetical protein
VGSLTFNVLFSWCAALVREERFGLLQRVLSSISVSEHFADSFSRGLLDGGHLLFYVAATTGVLPGQPQLWRARRWR